MKSGDDGERDSDHPGDIGSGWRQVAQRLYEPDRDGELTTTLVAAVAEGRGVPWTELEVPLYDAVDAAALESTLFSSNGTSESCRGTGTVEFEYESTLVQVSSDGWIHVYEPIGDGRR